MANSETNKPAPLELSEEDNGTVTVFDPSDTGVDKDEHTGTAGDADDLDSDPNAGHEDERAPVRDRAEEDEGVLEGGGTDAELNAAKSDKEREQIKLRRRRSREHKRKQAQERERDLNNLLAAERETTRQLAERLAVVERRTNGADLAQLDNAVREANGRAEHFKALAASAANANNGAVQTDALEKMIEARNQASHLLNIRGQMVNQASQPAGPDPVVIAHARAWMGKNDWYNPQGADEDSRVVLSLDQSVKQEGYQPNTPAYWEALDKKIAKYLPHRVGRGGSSSDTSNGDTLPGDGRQRPSKSTTTGSGRQGANGSRSGGFTLSQARVDALKESGQWDNPVERDAAIRYYREYDRTHRPDGSRSA